MEWPYSRDGLIRGKAFGGSGLITGIALSGCGFTTGMAFGGSVLITGMVLSGCGFIRGETTESDINCLMLKETFNTIHTMLFIEAI